MPSSRCSSPKSGGGEQVRVNQHPDDGQPVIVVEGLVNKFGEHAVHDGLDLTVRRGEILGVVGGSGTGKSVLMRSIIGLQQPSAGRIDVLGRCITESDLEQGIGVRRRWAILFQRAALFSTLTVGENVERPI
ncbi:MAG: ATP-binding cassette domain-containing protein, partial [Porphyrobacter sp.]|nr:ATP-binding cassette domain-containing protein [Porphyrobacter sp.]